MRKNQKNKTFIYLKNVQKKCRRSLMAVQKAPAVPYGGRLQINVTAAQKDGHSQQRTLGKTVEGGFGKRS
ncbi:MAG: hypothetical protein LUC47_10245 [Clostridiales bacterium]|nr:hypothetical protein [Clostridiales bacterium]